ncbi:hypothetical protein J3R82DRAFT_1086 [Butyriboletus roseoflavus]|nr:hypothetical protein J3R82DRAFT_1086 [Butyriboletus roseoflavus]
MSRKHRRIVGCSASSPTRVSLQPGVAAIHGDPHLDLPPALPHTSPRVSPASSATSVTRTECRSIRSVHISNSLVLWISVLHRGSQSYFNLARCHTCNATLAFVCGGGVISCLFRQTNIIWVMYAFAASQLMRLRFRRGNILLHDPPALSAGPGE